MSKWGLQYAHKTDAFSATPIWRHDAAQMRSLLRYRNCMDCTYLDLGCGTGRLLEKLGPLFRKVIGVDPNAAGFGLAAQRAPEAELYHSLDSLAPNSVDVCTIMHALPQMDNPAATLTELWKKMVPGGLLIAVTHNKNFSRLRWPKDVLTGYKSDPTITTNFTLGSLVQLMRDTGFLVEGARRYGYSGWARYVPFCAPRLIVHARKPT